MDPITLTLLIKLAVSAFAIMAIIAILTYLEVINWFVDRTELKEADREHVAFTLQQKLSNGDYKTVQGIFNKRTAKVADGRAIESKKVDTEMAQIHRDKELAIYT